MTRFCDHIYITVKDLEKPVEASAQTQNAGSSSGSRVIYSEWVKGKLLVCHFCGHRKEVWEDGTIITLKNESTR